MAAREEPQTEDLIIKADAKSLLDKHKLRMEEMFQVEFSYGTQCQEGNQWVNIKGLREDRKDAKNYVKALCSPKDAYFIRYPPHMKEFLRKLHLKIEGQSGAVVIFGKNATIEVRGSDTMAVTLAYSLIEDKIACYGEQPIERQSPCSNNASMRLDQELRRLSSGQHELYESDLSGQSMNDAVKRTFLSALKESQDETDTPLCLLPGDIQSKTPVKSLSHRHSPVTRSSPAIASTTGNGSFESHSFQDKPQLLPPAAFGPKQIDLSQILSPSKHQYTGPNQALSFETKLPAVLNSNGGFPVFGAEQIKNIERGYRDDLDDDKAYGSRKVNGSENDKPRTITQQVKIVVEEPKPVISRQSESSQTTSVGEKQAFANQPNEQEDHLFAVGIENAFSEKEIHRVFKEKGSKMTQEEFVSILRLNRGARPKQTNLSSATAAATKSVASDTGFPRAPSDKDLKSNPALTPVALQPKYSELGNYLDKRQQDESMEEGCSREQLKANNFERQKILREAYLKSRTNSPQNTPSKPLVVDEEKSSPDVVLIDGSEEDDVIELTDEEGGDSDEHNALTPENPEPNPGGVVAGGVKRQKRNKKKKKRKSKSKESRAAEGQNKTDFVQYETRYSGPEAKPTTSTNQRQQEPIRYQHRRSPSPIYGQQTRSRSPQFDQAALIGHGSYPSHTHTTRRARSPHYQYVPQPGPLMPNPTHQSLRYVVIDGSNIAMAHGNHRIFSCRGIEIAINYFLQRGHKQITAFVPQHRRTHRSTEFISDPHILEELTKNGYLNFTPSRKIPGKGNITCYDDRFVVDLANQTDGVILTNDNYRDLYNEKREWRTTIETSILMYSFVGDILMIPDDPLGKDGPSLDEFLRSNTNNNNQVSRFNPHQNNPNMQNQWHQPRPQFHQRWQQPQSLMGLVPNPYQGGAACQGPRGNGLLPNPTQGNYIPGLPPHLQRMTSQPNAAPARPWIAPKQTQLPERTQKETNELRIKLQEIFTDDDVDKILKNHPREKDLQKLSSYVLDAQPK